MDPDEIEQLAGTITGAEYMQAVNLYGESAQLSLDQRERELKAMQVLIGERKLAEGTSWPGLFDGISPEQVSQLRDLYDAMPDGARAEYDRRYGRPEEI
jgi:hypothetical protein